jgi:hypothetical protein
MGYRLILLHKLDHKTPAWAIAANMGKWPAACIAPNLPVDAAVGEGAASEFRAYLAVYDDLPDLDAIVAGKGDIIAFPKEASSRWATTTGLTVRSQKPPHVLAVFQWLIAKGTEEWVQLLCRRCGESIPEKEATWQSRQGCDEGCGNSEIYCPL